MKKLLILLIPILFLIGCDSEEVFSKTCTKKISSLDITDTTKTKVIYNNKDEVVKVIVTRTYKALNDDGVLLLADIKKSAADYNNNLAKSKAIKIKNIEEDNKYIIKYYLDVLKMNEAELDEFNIRKNSIKYFNKMKKDGIKCKYNK